MVRMILKKGAGLFVVWYFEEQFLSTFLKIEICLDESTADWLAAISKK